LVLLLFDQSPSHLSLKRQGKISTNFVFGLNPFGVILQNSQKKTRKEKEKRKREKGHGKHFGLEPEGAHGPIRKNPKPVILSPSHLADVWAPSVIPLLRPKITPGSRPSH
jgi:hypothetical protein